MNFNYDDATRKQFTPSDDVDGIPSEMTRENLVQLLLYLEGEIDNRDKTIETLKEEKAKLILFEAKYGMNIADPIRALKNDAKYTPDLQPQASIGELFDSHADGLERITDGYQKAYEIAQSIAQSAEDRLDLAMNDLHIEREWKNKGFTNETMEALKEENQRLKEEVERYNKCISLSKKESDEAEKKRQSESQRHKTIFLFLMNDRRELLSTLGEMQFRKNSECSTSEQKTLIDDLRKQVELLVHERESIRNVNKAMKGEIVALKEVARSQEEDLHMLRNNLVAGMSIDKNMDDGSVIMSNRTAKSGPSRNLASSSSFPSDKSRLPRAPGISSSPTSQLPSKLTIGKKTPAMGVSTMRRTVDRRGVGGLASDNNIASKLVRSSSLRGQSEPRPPLTASIPSIRPTTTALPNVSPSSIQSSTLSRLPSKSDAKITQITKSKSSLLRAFGK